MQNWGTNLSFGLRSTPTLLQIVYEMTEQALNNFAARCDNHAIDEKNIVATIPDQDGQSSLTIHIEPNGADAAAPPTVRFTKSLSNAAPSKPPTVQVDETHIIVSTGSGGKLAQKFYNTDLKPVLKALFPDHTSFKVHTTESATSILNLTNNVFLPKANSGTSLQIILLSGDGGIIDLVNGLLSKPHSANYTAPKTVLIPLGTANALYHSINAGKDHTWGLRSLTTETYKPLPIFTVTFSPGARLLTDEARVEEELPKDPENGQPILHGAVVCSWGMHASLVADSDTHHYRQFGIDRFKMAAKENLYPDSGQPHVYKARVSVLKSNPETKSETWTNLETEEHMYVLATLVSNLEKTFTISPHSKPLDGSMYLVHFGPRSGDEAMEIMNAAYDGGKHVADEALLYEAVEGLKIEFKAGEEDRRVCVDGKIVRVEEGGWIEVRKEERRVLSVAA